MVEGKVRQRDFTMYQWSSTIPMTDDVYLGMQARNIAIIDMSILRPMEAAALEEFFEYDRISLPTTMKLSALSQMWMFALYEFMRTWRQRARTLVGFADRLALLKSPEERNEYIGQLNEQLKARARFARLGPASYQDHVAKVSEDNFIGSIRAYKEKTETLFRDVEAIRMPLAKHEIAGTGKERLLAEAPGYGGVSKLNGSMYWQIVLTDGSVALIERRRLANQFLGIMNEFEEETVAQEHEKKEPGDNEPEEKLRRRRRRRRRHEGAVLESRGAVAASSPEGETRKRRRRGRRGGRRRRREASSSGSLVI